MKKQTIYDVDDVADDDNNDNNKFLIRLHVCFHIFGTYRKFLIDFLILVSKPL